MDAPCNSADGLLSTARRYVADRNLPDIGFVLFQVAGPFAWSRHFPDAASVVPGVIAVALDESRYDYVAVGGDEHRGAARWEPVDRLPMAGSQSRSAAD